MKTNTLTSVTIGIPAYQAENNIIFLLKSLTKQKEKRIKIEKIIVYSDGCTDKTVERAKTIRNTKIKIINAGKNRGLTYAFQYLIRENKSDIFVLLNDDIKIKSDNVISNLTSPILDDETVGLVGGLIVPLPPKTFVGKCIWVSTRAYDEAALRYKHGQNFMTFDGKIMAFKKNFTDNLKLNNRPTGNLDIYIYFENLRQHRQYVLAKSAKVYYRLPQTIADFRNQEIRNIISRKIVAKQFGPLFVKQLNGTKIVFFKFSLAMLLRYPIESIFFKIVINNFHISINKKLLEIKTWNTPYSTKLLS